MLRIVCNSYTITILQLARRKGTNLGVGSYLVVILTGLVGRFLMYSLTLVVGRLIACI